MDCRFPSNNDNHPRCAGKGGAGNDCTACVTRCGRDGIGEEKVPVAFPPLRIDFKITDISANFCAVPSDIGD